MTMLLDAPPRTGTGLACGTFGELLQGATGPGEEFMVTLPIDRWTTARFTPDPEGGGVRTMPEGKWKSRRLAEQLLASLRLPGGGELTLRSELPEGKGLASSSADLVATARAVASAWNVRLPAILVECLIGGIEPSDGVMHEGAVVFDHRRVRLRRRLPPLPEMTIVGLDEGGTLDTLSLEPRRHERRQELFVKYRALLDALVLAIERSDYRGIGAVGTHSAALNQALVPRRNLEAVTDLVDEVGAAGAATAHSGTCIGLLVSTEDPDHDARVEAARARLGQLPGELIVCRTVAAGGRRA